MNENASESGKAVTQKLQMMSNQTPEQNKNLEA